MAELLTVLRGYRPLAGPVPVGSLPQKRTFVNRQYWWFFYFKFCVYCLSGFRIQDSVASGQGLVVSGQEKGAGNKKQWANTHPLTPNTYPLTPNT